MLTDYSVVMLKIVRAPKRIQRKLVHPQSRDDHFAEVDHEVDRGDLRVTWQLRGQTWWMYSQGITFGILPTMSARRENFII